MGKKKKFQLRHRYYFAPGIIQARNLSDNRLLFWFIKSFFVISSRTSIARNANEVNIKNYENFTDIGYFSLFYVGTVDTYRSAFLGNFLRREI